MVAAHPLAVGRMLAVRLREGQPAGVAEAMTAGLQPLGHAHPLVEDVALASPAAVLLRPGLQVAQDSSLKMVHTLKALLLQVGGALLTADAAGAEHGDRLGPALFHQGPQLLLHPGGKLAEAFGAGVQRPLKGAQGHFVMVAGVNHQRGGVADQGVPLLGRHVGAHLLGRLHRGASHRHDLALQPHLEAMEGLRRCPAQPGFEMLQSRKLPQLCQQPLHPGFGTTDGAVDALFSQQDRASHTTLNRQLQQLAAQRRQLRHGGEAVEGRHLHRLGVHRVGPQRGASCHGLTPAAASRARSVSPAGFPVVSRVSP